MTGRRAHGEPASLGGMSAQSYALFETPVGWCGIVWGASGVAGVQLPERDQKATRTRLERRYAEAQEAAPPPAIRQAIERMTQLLSGEGGDLSMVVLDMSDIPPQRRDIYAVARSIPAGDTLSYGEIASRLSDGGDARDVGEAMARNPFPIIVPCHRVLAAGGKIGGFSAAGGVVTKLRLLEIEGAQVGEAPTLFSSLPLAMRPRQGS
jgi:methylated-DNA-[protein]-cysteine S-methyltransferase